MNVIHLLGRLVNDPDLKTTPNGNYVCRFRLAVSRNKYMSDFFNITAWDKTAEFAMNYFAKGDRIIIHGSLHNADYNDKNGKKQYVVEILADRLEFVDSKLSKEQQQQPKQAETLPEPITDYPN
jgi:single-strand DNA-binding protein